MCWLSVIFTYPNYHTFFYFKKKKKKKKKKKNWIITFWLRSPFTGRSDALWDGEARLQHRLDARANGEDRKFAFATSPDTLREACDLNCPRLDAHLTVWTVLEIKVRMSSFGSFSLISPPLVMISLGFFIENP